jgi:inhibitor of KinA
MTAATDNAPPLAAPSIHPLGVDGLLVRFGTELTETANRAALALRAAIDQADLIGLLETTTALTSVYLRFDLRHTDHATLRAAVGHLVASHDWRCALLPAGRRLWRIPAVFGTDLAPQLDDAAARAGLSAQAAVAQLCAARLRVQTIGFAPGQPYLGQLPEHWNIPRQTDLTPRVHEGALVVAIRQIVLFSISAPTGWRHVGQTALRLFRPDRADPFLLRPGDEVQFSAVTPAELANLRHSDTGGAIAQPIP